MAVILVVTGNPAGAAPAAAPAPTRVQSAAEALAQDADSYADRHGIAPDEALRRLRLQEASVPLTDALTREFSGRLAGLWIAHVPDWHVELLLTGAAPVADRVATIDGQPVRIVFHTGAAATRTGMLTALEAHRAALRAALPHPPGLGLDARSGSLVVMVAQADADAFAPGDLERRLAAIAHVPVAVRVVDKPAANMRVEGGARVVGVNPADGRRYACTTGFTVTDGARTGVVTAAHCPDALAYIDPAPVDPAAREVPLGFVGQWGWGFQDVQVHDSPAALDPLFFADTAKSLARPVTATRARAATRVGDTVCHRGERTGYSCAEVDYVDFAPAGDLCGGACTPTWVAVGGPTCKGGDSGGPVFVGTTAFGILKGGSYRRDGGCSFYYYMSVDYLPAGWSLMQALPDAAATVATR